MRRGEGTGIAVTKIAFLVLSVTVRKEPSGGVWFPVHPSTHMPPAALARVSLEAVFWEIARSLSGRQTRSGVVSGAWFFCYFFFVCYSFTTALSRIFQ